jgi:hypothetical protein
VDLVGAGMLSALQDVNQFAERLATTIDLFWLIVDME